MTLLILITTLSFAASPTRRLPDKERGGELYMKNCWMCHGKLAQGDGPAAVAFNSESPALAKQYKKSEWDKMIRIIMDGKGDMPAFSQVMDRHEARRILVWLDDPKPTKTVPKKSEGTKPKPKAKAAGTTSAPKPGKSESKD